MSYGPNFPDLYRRAGDYADKILRGAKPAELRCGSINACERPWASKPLPIDCDWCCTDRLMHRGYSGHRPFRAAKPAFDPYKPDMSLHVVLQ